MNLSGLPVAQKPAKAKARLDYLAAVRELPCVICNRMPCEAHHPIMGRYGQRRVPDIMAIPLCPDCHRGLHAGKETWAALYGPDTDFIAPTQDKLAHLLEEKR